MPTAASLLRSAERSGGFGWDLACRAFDSEDRHMRLKPDLARRLARSAVAFLPEVGEDTFLRRDRATDPAPDRGLRHAYRAELRRLRPTKREEEFILARSIDLLRETLLCLLGKRPPAAALAVAQEHLSPYSPVLERLRSEGVRGVRRTWTSEKRDRLYQRLAELHTLQSALVERNLHLVPFTAQKYAHVGVPFDDLVQEGNASLLRAVEKYDRNEGTRFAVYAGWWIQQGILKALSFQSRSVRLPVYLAQVLHRVRQARAAHFEPLSDRELAERVQSTPEKVRRAIEADRACYSIDQPAFGEEDDARLRDRLQDPRDWQGGEPLAPGQLRACLSSWLDRLPAREALILRLRYGLEDERAWTLEQVGDRLGISRERVRQLHAQALTRLTRPAARRELGRFVA